MDVRAGPQRRLSTEELMLSNCVLEKAFESHLDSKEIKPVNLKGSQPWIFIGSTDAEAIILWPPDVRSWLNGKDPDAGKDWGQQEKGATEDELVGWHHWLKGLECEQALRDGEGQGSLVCCSPSGHKESDMTEQLNNKMGQNTFWETQHFYINLVSGDSVVKNELINIFLLTSSRKQLEFSGINLTVAAYKL